MHIHESVHTASDARGRIESKGKNECNFAQLLTQGVKMLQTGDKDQLAPAYALKHGVLKLCSRSSNAYGIIWPTQNEC